MKLFMSIGGLSNQAASGAVGALSYTGMRGVHDAAPPRSRHVLCVCRVCAVTRGCVECGGAAARVSGPGGVRVDGRLDAAERARRSAVSRVASCDVRKAK